MPCGIPWPAERLERLKQLVEDGLTSGEIAREMGISRGSVMGMVNRQHLKLKGAKLLGPNGWVEQRKAEFKKRQEEAMAWVQGKPRKLPRGAPPKPIVLPPTGPVRLVDAERHHCRWPIEEVSANMRVCGAQAVENMSYCTHHCAIAYPGFRKLVHAEIAAALKELGIKSVVDIGEEKT